ncbi:SDR family oxidoreductase [Staphylococcus pasteuri]|uniref:SDR family oxidoreductase n=1 Tax=Staphylococcus pasteuri TaxID=45972 RepID=UPI0024C17EC2
MNDKVLVTGGTGFLGMRIISELLKDGYEVRTTVRKLDKKQQVIKTLQNNHINTDKLEFAEADLSKDEHWNEVMRGCKYVLSVASPVFFEIPEDENEVIRPAIEGIQRILRAAEKENVKKVVMTSNFGAVGFSNKDKSTITTEKNWTNQDEPGLSAYEKSKLLAEKAAWDFVNNKDNQIEFATINPVAVLGKSMDSHVSGSFDMIKNIMNGSMKRVPNVPLNVVDVRDVARLHVLAMKSDDANGKRFIASADGQITLAEIAKLVKNKRPELSEKVSTKTLPNFAINIGAYFNKEAKEGKLLLNMNRNISNEQAKSILGWRPIGSQEDAVLEAVDSMAKYNLF